ncbi:MAG: tyrosine-protein kinase family protein [Bacilli bacterium]|nr:tyrosine-protein kinase family protein [Bacilli bacterium]
MAKTRNGKVISISSVKGGVGKTTMAINLAGIYYSMGKKVLIIDADFFSGGISVWLDIRNKKDIYTMINNMANNMYTNLEDYVTSYNNGIDVLASPRDPRSAMKIESKYIPVIFDFARKIYDVIIVDTNHIMNEINLMILDNSYMSLFMITNDLIDLKNMKSIVSIFKDTDKRNFLVCLNNSRDTGRDYISLFDMRNIIKCNIDYTISNSFYIKNIDKYVMDGEILTLNKTINRFHAGDISKLRSIANILIDDKYKDGDINE